MRGRDGARPGGREGAREEDGKSQALAKDAERRGADAERDIEASKKASLLDRYFTGIFFFYRVQVVYRASWSCY